MNKNNRRNKRPLIFAALIALIAVLLGVLMRRKPCDNTKSSVKEDLVEAAAPALPAIPAPALADKGRRSLIPFLGVAAGVIGLVLGLVWIASLSSTGQSVKDSTVATATLAPTPTHKAEEAPAKPCNNGLWLYRVEDAVPTYYGPKVTFVATQVPNIGENCTEQSSTVVIGFRQVKEPNFRQPVVLSGEFPAGFKPELTWPVTGPMLDLRIQHLVPGFTFGYDAKGPYVARWEEDENGKFVEIARFHNEDLWH